MMFCISCKTTKTEDEFYFPEINFPDFPVLNEYEITDDGKVCVSADYFFSLFLFRELYFSEIDKYNEKINKIGNCSN